MSSLMKFVNGNFQQQDIAGVRVVRGMPSGMLHRVQYIWNVSKFSRTIRFGGTRATLGQAWIGTLISENSLDALGQCLWRGCRGTAIMVGYRQEQRPSTPSADKLMQHIIRFPTRILG